MTHIVKIIESLPFEHYTKHQVATLLNTSPRAIQYLSNVGRLYGNERIRLRKTGQYFLKNELLTFLNKTHATTKRTTTR